MRSSLELSRLLSSVLSPVCPLVRPASLHSLCLRTAAIYATTALYEFHDKQMCYQASMATGSHSLPQGIGGLGVPGSNGPLDIHSNSIVNESMWDAVFPLLDAHFLQLVPQHLYEQFLDHVLCALEVAAHYDSNGKALMQYIILFFPPKTMKRFKAHRCYKDRVLVPTVCCLYKCTNIEELYLEKLSDSSSITPYLLAHILKFLHELKVLALPKQADDDVISIVGLNCPKLECIVLTNTSVSNIGLSWLLCCMKLHTVIMPGFFQGVTPKGVALLLNGLPGLRHIVYDTMSDVLTFVDFNTSDTVVRTFGLRTILFHSMELLSSNHLELVTKLCPYIEWLSLDSALFYNLEGLGKLQRLKLLRLNYKGRQIDDTVIDFFGLICSNLTTLHLFEVRDLTVEDLRLTVAKCHSLEVLVLNECSISPEWRTSSTKVISRSIDHLQLFGLQWQGSLQLWVDFVSLFRDLHILEMDRCHLDIEQLKALLLDQPLLHTLRCAHWTFSTTQSLSELQVKFRHCHLQLNKQSFLFDEDEIFCDRRTIAVRLLAEYASFGPTLPVDS